MTNNMPLKAITIGVLSLREDTSMADLILDLDIVTIGQLRSIIS